MLKKEKDSDRVLEGAVFALCNKEDIVNENGDVILKADTVIEEQATDKEGKLTFTADLPIGYTYYVKETSPAPGFATTDQVQEFTFEYDGADKETLSYEFTFEDEPTVVEITKTSLTDGKELEGAKLEVTDEDGKAVDSWTSGKEAHIIKELVAGKKYTLTETKPADGYVTAESITFTVEDSSKAQKIEMKDDVTKVQISKTDISGKELPGAKLTILDKDVKMDGKIQESLWDIVKPVLDILHSKCIVDKAKDDLGYVLKTNFIFEWVLENGLEMLSTDDDIEAIYTKIVSVLGTKDISAANNLYFCDAANEIKEFTELLENIPSLKNDVPKKDLAYKSGRETEKYSRENILEASKWKEIIQYIADRVKISEEIFLGKRQYGSFLLRYLNIDNLMFSSGERVFQNVMSWIYFLGYFNKYIVKSEHHTRKDLLICLDEIDLSLHPAWQRDFVDYLVAYINSCYKENNVQIIMTTHSPLCLSNFPSSNIIYLRKTENGTEVDLSEHKETFGTNLYEILDDAFYLGCDSMGRFARKYIQKVIEEIMELSYLNQEDYYRYKQKIGCIGDTLIRNKLGEQLSKKLKETEGQRVAVDAIDKEIKQLELRRKKITEEMSGSTKISEE